MIPASHGSHCMRAALVLTSSMLLFGCASAPIAGSLGGRPVPAVLPVAELPPGHRQLVFRWEYRDRFFEARGEGSARIAPPDSVRLDFFVDGGMGGGSAIVVGDSIVTPGNNDARRFLPPPPLLWSALGRLAVPSAADTTATRSADTLRADIGRDPVWRVTFVSNNLARVERIAGGHLLEWVSRPAANDVRYRNEGSARQLSLDITRSNAVAPFESRIWHY